MLDLLQYVNNKPGLWALGALGFLILIYLIKPKTKDRVIPSLIFLIKQSGKSKKQSFFRKLMRDWLLLFHFLIILGLAIGVADPIYFTDKNIDAEFTVLVLDVSASMQAQGAFGNNFDKMISEAKEFLNSEKISILVVENDPRLVLDEGNREKALEIIATLEPKEGLSPIGNAVLAASDIVGDKEGRIIVISDFINSYGLDPGIAKASVEAKDRAVQFVNLKTTSRKNVGIVNLEFIDDQTRVTIHNFNNEPVLVPLKVNQDDLKITIPELWEEKISFKHQPGINKITLDFNDDFPVDNIAYVSVPQKTKKRILLLTNKAESFIYPLLLAYQDTWNDHIIVEKAEPPKLPIIDHQIIIVDSVDLGKFPSSVQQKIIDSVKEGKTQLIVAAQDDLKSLKLADILPVKVGSLEAEADIFNQNALSQVTKDVGFTKVGKHYKTTLKDKALSIARTNDNSSVITLKGYGDGTVVYYGIFDEVSNFKYDVSYPIFWQQLLDYLLGDGTLEDLNYRIKDQIILDTETTITTPTKTKKIQVVDFDETGVYTIKNRQVAVNLLNTLESNINFDFEQTVNDLETAAKEDSKAKKRIVHYFVYAILALLFLELLYVKLRGDL